MLQTLSISKGKLVPKTFGKITTFGTCCYGSGLTSNVLTRAHTPQPSVRMEQCSKAVPANTKTRETDCDENCSISSRPLPVWLEGRMGEVMKASNRKIVYWENGEMGIHHQQCNNKQCRLTTCRLAISLSSTCCSMEPNWTSNWQ